MIQMTQHHPDIYASLTDTVLGEHFRTAGDRLAEESAILAAAIGGIMASEGHITNKGLILWLIKTLETTDDATTADAIRRTLEIVVAHTMDDI
ncbi:TPA: two-component-system connector protein AriR [Pluralibacter gergoviae]|uniref:Two-component-system connector protein AriR n=1 Tax=Pluralibacter gergoviae TaxID=61647 RepID=A0A0J5KYP8_PLUGE|nr:biofilm development regulator YmgB/AriR family protein [Pluralibacter gergoviae]KMK11665.1 two-component-system connector protein AriR [Pluralibacter gergoviae]KMK19201.1 two-component-system connector protein AriR [Pluralibacter gergoviae]KMK25744.1 two-component-system connector protein AriR [Pluralibacter gergoviae]KOQ98900.1 two-component-system connector protein AriR [Pluralibacter gergoviae]MBK4115139.1 two-component-system connector protein AriR [Pluralibacter gergoviae]